MADSLALNYVLATPGADSNTYVLFDSTSSTQVGNTGTYLRNYRRYGLLLVNSQPGTLIAEFSDDKGVTWTQYAQQAVIAATAQRANQVGLPIAGFDAVRIRWINGGSAQSPLWLVHQWLDDSSSAAFYVDSSGTTQGPTAQLPATLGQKTSAQSLSTVPASDSALQAATSLRGPNRTECYAIAASTSSQTFTVPAAWVGKIVEMFADGADFYLQISNAAGTPAVVDNTTRTSQSGSPLALTVSGNEGKKIPNGTMVPVTFLATAVTFALQASAAGTACLRANLAQT